MRMGGRKQQEIGATPSYYLLWSLKLYGGPARQLIEVGPVKSKEDPSKLLLFFAWGGDQYPSIFFNVWDSFTVIRTCSHRKE